MQRPLAISALILAASTVFVTAGSSTHSGASQAAATAPPPQAAAAATEFAPYTEPIPDTKISFDMVPVKGGSLKMGSPASEPGRGDDEGPQVEATVKAFWMGAREVTWEEYDLFAFAKRRPAGGPPPTAADAVSKPTPPYADESWGFGKGKQPALGMTWHAAAEYCRWLSAKTGHPYRLPTEAEWEYAARAGSSTPWSSGKDAASLTDVAWFAGDADAVPHKVGTKKPNAFGLYDMHGNVAEWTLDQYDAKRYASLASQKGLINPVLLPGDARYPHVVRGGSFEDDAAHLRSAARRASKPEWSRRDPQQPQSIWWHTDAIFVGFRIVEPVQETDALKGFRSKITRESPDQ
jgi:formylglycine-generating enzyme required for sulfatase activity